MKNQLAYAVLIKFGRKKIIYDWEDEREHYQLNNWMLKLYLSKNPNFEHSPFTIPSFEVELILEDLEAFEYAIYEDMSYDAPEDCFDDYERGKFMDEDSEFLDHAKQAISEGCAVFYSSVGCDG
jgi:hypothetical protein